MGIKDVKQNNPGKYEENINQMMDSLPRKKDGTVDWPEFKRKKRK